MKGLVTKLISFAFLAVALSGCNTASKAIESASQKSLVGNGFLAVNKITVSDTSTGSYTPQLFSMFLHGEYVSLLKNSNFLFYDKKESSSVLNANATTTEENLIIQTDDKTSVAEVIRELTELIRAQRTLHLPY